MGTKDLPRYFQALAVRNELPTLDELHTMATELFKMYSTSAAHICALHPNSESEIAFPMGDARINPSANGNLSFDGDWALANSILLMRDGLWFLEVCQAVTCGDIGRVWEVFKVRTIANKNSNVTDLPHLNLDLDFHVCRSGK